MNLTAGALAKICDGQEVADPVLQVLGHKPIQGSGQERYRLLLSDGQYSNSFSMLATQLNNLIHENQLSQYSIIKVKKHVCNSMNAASKKVVVILELEVLKPGSEVGERLGSPVTIGADGKVPASANQNANPNAGAAAKRPAGPVAKQDQPPIKTTPASTTRSVLTPRSTTTPSGAPIAPISSITPYQNKWTIKARVTSKTDIKTWNKSTGSGKLFSMDLMDESGEIRITAFKDQCDAFYEKATVGKVYYISNCSVKNANKAYSKLNNDYELTFKDNGTFDQCDDDSDIPTINYNFVGINDLGSINKDSYCDVIGVCKSAGDLVDLQTKAGKNLIKREVVLMDRTATCVSLTLWGNTAQNFDGVGNPIVAAKNAKVSDYNGVTLSGSEILINPDIEIAHELKGWWDNEGVNTEGTSITTSGGGRGAEGQGGANVKLLGEVKQENLGFSTEKADYYSTYATITFFSKDKALYKSCGEAVDGGKTCQKKVMEQGENQYRCEKCQVTKSTFTWRMILQVNMADTSDNVWATCFQDSAEKILGVNAESLGAALDRDEDEYNSIFTEATFKTFNYKMRAKNENYNDENRVKHSVVEVNEIDYEKYCSTLIKEIESLGGSIPENIERDSYLK